MIKPPSPPYNMNDLKAVMAALRDPDNGCPWDLEQTYQTILPYTLEEAYEVADAITRKDFNNLQEELGDLLLQSVYHAQMASEDNHFTIDDVIHDITAKMIARHPHVFDEEPASSASDVNKIWDQKKDQEKEKQDSLMDGVPQTFPALLRTHKLQKRAAKVGFEWPNTNGVLDKIQEEVKELQEALNSGKTEDIQDELGDVFFTLVNFARMSGFKSEEALRLANTKFEQRFRTMEEILKKKEQNLEDLTLEQMEKAWKQAKRQKKT